MMLTTEQINDLHRLYWSEHWPIRKIERDLNIGWKTIRKYLEAPAQGRREMPFRGRMLKAGRPQRIKRLIPNESRKPVLRAAEPIIGSAICYN